MKSFEDITKDAGKALWRRATKSHDPWGLEKDKVRTPSKKEGGIWHNGTFLGTKEQAAKLPMKEMIRQGVVKQVKKPFAPSRAFGFSVDYQLDEKTGKMVRVPGGDGHAPCPDCAYHVSKDGKVGIGKGHFNIVTGKWGGTCRNCHGRGIV